MSAIYNTEPVSREKYDNMKDKANKWRDECEQLKEKFIVLQDLEADLDKMLALNNKLLEENDTLSNNKELLDELENENKIFRKDIRCLKKENKTLVEDYNKKLANLERDILLKDGKIQRLEEAKKDNKERYNELKEDFREQQRWNRQQKD